MNFYASVAMRAELGRPVSLLHVFFQGPAILRMYIIRDFFVLNQTLTIYVCFPLSRRLVDGSCLGLVFERAISMCA